LGSVLPKIISFFLIPVYTYYLTPRDFGIVDLALNLGAFLLIAMRMGVPGAVTRFYYDQSEGKDLNDYLTTIYWFIIYASLIIGAITLLTSQQFIDNLIPGLPFAPFVILVVISALFNSNTDLQRRLIQVREQSVFSAKLSTSRTILTIALTILLVVVFKYGAFGVVLATTVVAVLYFIQAQIYLSKNLKGQFKTELLRSSLIYASGILPAHLLTNFTPLATRSILSNMDSLAAVGILGIAVRFTNPLMIVSTAFQNAYLPIYFSIRKSGSQENLNKLTIVGTNIWFVSLILFLGMVMIAPGIVSAILPKEYSSVEFLIPILSVGFIFQVIYNLFGLEIYYSKKTFWVTFMAVFSASSNLFIVFLFVDYIGVYSLVIGMIVAQLIVAILGVWLSKKRVNIPYNITFFIKSSILVSLLVIIFFSFKLNIEMGLEADILIGLSLIGTFIYLMVRFKQVDLSGF